MKKDNNAESSIEDREEMDEIDKILQQKYNEVVVPDEMFDTTRVFERYEKEQKKKRNVLKVASVIVILLVVCLAIGVKLNINVNDDTENIDNTGVNNVDDEMDIKPGISGDLNMSLNMLSLENSNLEILYTTLVEEILGYEIIDGIPSTILRARVLKDYLYDVEGDVEMIVPGGVFTIKEIKDNINQEDIEFNEDNINEYNDEDTVNVTCYNNIYIPMAEVGKTYLTSLYEKDGKLFVCANLKYGFKEYDVENNTIKDIDGNDVEVEIEKYISNNIK